METEFSKVNDEAGHKVKNPLRVLHLNSLLMGGGTDDRSVKVAHALSQMGCGVWLAGPAGREFSDVARGLGIPFHHVSLGPLKLPLIVQTAQFIRRERVQIIHARHGRDYWPAILAAKLSATGAKVVLSRHLAKSPGSLFSRRLLLGRCDAMLACSEFVRRILVEGVFEPSAVNPERRKRPPMFGDHKKIRVVYGGIDVERFKPADGLAQRAEWGLTETDYAFGVAGGYTLPRGKGQREFLAAAARMAPQFPNGRFLIIGRGNLKETLLADIERLGLRGRAWLTPYSRDMPSAMNALDCLVHPQVGTESWGSVVCEAHACGKPVLASRLDGIPEAFDAGAYGELIEPDSVDVLEAAMRRWALRPPLAGAERAALHTRVGSRFSLEQAAKNLFGVYESLFNQDA